MSVAAAVEARGHLAATFELYQFGFGRAELASAVRRGDIVRVRQGWYLSPHVSGPLREAIRVGGRATCVSALSLSGYWAPPSPRLHVSVKSTDARLRSRTNKRRPLLDATARIHWTDHAGGSRLLVDPISALVHACECLPIDLVAACANSVLRLSPGLRPAWKEELEIRLPKHPELRTADGVCESGIEHLFWLRMRDRVPSLRRQVTVPLVGRVDFVIGERLVIEVDGLAYHVDPERFEADRARDATASTMGLRVQRFSYEQVMNDWISVERAVLAAVARSDHH